MQQVHRYEASLGDSVKHTCHRWHGSSRLHLERPTTATTSYQWVRNMITKVAYQPEGVVLVLICEVQYSCTVELVAIYPVLLRPYRTRADLGSSSGFTFNAWARYANRRGVPS